MRKQPRQRHHLRRQASRRLSGPDEGYAYFRDVLPNGLRVVTVETPHLHSALLAVYVRTGSRHETPAENGVSHFVEHMLFRGSRRHPDTVRMNATVEAVGGNLNGVTTRDHGYYFTPVHPAHLGVALDVLGDMLTFPLFNHFAVEREIILEELLDEVDEKGRDIELDNIAKKKLFPHHPLSLHIAGTAQSVKRLTKSQLRRHFAQHYVTGNLVVTAAGRVSRDEVLSRVARAFAQVPTGPGTTESAPLVRRDGPNFHQLFHDESQTEVRLSFLTVPEGHPDHAALQLIRRILDDGLSSRLPFHVIEKKGLAYSLQASIETFHDVGLFDIDAATAPSKAAAVVDEVCATLGALCVAGATAEELQRAKKRHRMFLEFARDSPGELAGWFGGTELFRTPETFLEKCAEIEKVTRKELQAVAARYFRRKNLWVTAIGQRRGARALEKASLRAGALPDA